MFVDYYALLEIDHTASLTEIKSAFRQQALKWHPDRNPGTDTTDRMQLINEAYLILKDVETKHRYDIEYQRYKHTLEYRRDKKKSKKEEGERNTSRADSGQRSKSEHHKYESYVFHDDVLMRWILDARDKAVDLAKQTIENVFIHYLVFDLDSSGIQVLISIQDVNQLKLNTSGARTKVRWQSLVINFILFTLM